MNKKPKFKKSFYITVALLLFMIAAVVILNIYGVSTNEIRAYSHEISAIRYFSDTYYVGAGNELFKTDIKNKGQQELIKSFDSKIIDIAICDEKIAVVTENRMISLISFDGEVISQQAILYAPKSLRVFDNEIFVFANISVDRSKIYRFDNELNLLDLTPGVNHEPKRDSESDAIYTERINCLLLDYSVLDFYYEHQELITISAYGYINVYINGERAETIILEHTPNTATLFENKIYLADLSGGYKVYDFNLNLLGKFGSIKNQTAIYVNESMVFISDINGNIECFDSNGQWQYSLNLASRISGMAFGENFSVFSVADNIYVYQTSAMRKVNLLKTLRLISYLATGVTIAFLIIIFIKQRYLSAYKKIKTTTVKILRDILKSRWIYLALSPAILLALTFAYYPAISGFLLAFLRIQPDGTRIFIGLNNFVELANKEFFWSGLSNMLIFLVTDILKGLIPAFIFAELIIAMRSARAQYFTRVMMYLPGIIPGVTALLIWTNGIFGIDGVLNSLINLIGGKSVNWLGNNKYALISLIFIGFPWIGSYIILYGALNGIPKSFYEAAEMDGCNWFKRLLKIDLPMISPQMKYIFILTFIGSIQDFQRVYLTTEGAFGTYTPMLELYYNLTLFNNYGMAAAMGLVLFGILMIATLLNLKIKTVDSFD